jgi:hypothetical protein
MLLLPLVFIGEGMFDQWFVAAYLPLALARPRLRVDRAAVESLHARRARHRGRLVILAITATELPPLRLRRDHGRLLMKEVPAGAAFATSTDDATVIPCTCSR